MSRLRNVLLITVFLLAVAMHSFAGEPEPVARIDLQPLGLKASNKDFYTDTRGRWWRQYIVIDSTYVACGKCGPDSTYTETPGPRLVIDSTTGKQVPPEIVADAVFEPNPQDVWYPMDPQENPEGILAQWRGMTLVRDKDRKLWLKEPGYPDTLLFSQRDYRTAVFISPELILLMGEISDHPNRTFSKIHQRVIDKTGALKYKLSAWFTSPWSSYFALNRAGGRFAVRDSVPTRFDTVLGALSLSSENISDNVTRVRVFAADDGKKLFEYKWGRKGYEIDSRRGIALSEDGTLLALVKGTDLLIFRVP